MAQADCRTYSCKQSTTSLATAGTLTHSRGFCSVASAGERGTTAVRPGRGHPGLHAGGNWPYHDGNDARLERAQQEAQRGRAVRAGAKRELALVAVRLGARRRQHGHLGNGRRRGRLGGRLAAARDVVGDRAVHVGQHLEKLLALAAQLLLVGHPSASGQQRREDRTRYERPRTVCGVLARGGRTATAG